MLAKTLRAHQGHQGGHGSGGKGRTEHRTNRTESMSVILCTVLITTLVMQLVIVQFALLADVAGTLPGDCCELVLQLLLFTQQYLSLHMFRTCLGAVKRCMKRPRIQSRRMRGRQRMWIAALCNLLDLLMKVEKQRSPRTKEPNSNRTGPPTVDKWNYGIHQDTVEPSKDCYGCTGDVQLHSSSRGQNSSHGGKGSPLIDFDNRDYCKFHKVDHVDLDLDESTWNYNDLMIEQSHDSSAQGESCEAVRQKDLTEKSIHKEYSNAGVDTHPNCCKSIVNSNHRDAKQSPADYWQRDKNVAWEDVPNQHSSHNNDNSKLHPPPQANTLLILGHLLSGKSKDLGKYVCGEVL